MPAAPQRTSYASHPVSIPAGFLEDAPAKPVTVTPIRWSPALPEYEGAVAAVLDNVLSPEECAQLLCLAESSVVLEKGAASPWRPALVSAGAGWEVPIFDYRNSDRIVWDQQTIVNRLWDRCRQGRGVEALFGRTPADRERGHLSGRWVFERVNERMRFLKYSPGQFFRPHCDGPYYHRDESGSEMRTHYTVHLYLNDSAQASAAGTGHVGGATSFLSRDESRRLDVHPKAGSVLIFQHGKLYHEGAEVTSGVKYTMRTDILYRWVDREGGDK
ncbi:uncharacterized protein UV8b_07608 [Ustilaginoidea virens]|uniref:Prolyl 4-hydroxylase alpha subunit domain-containing protein n=1 Tax=Ustilaginoidea virens TaxID=1159556 RepID=A0A8E5HXM9_USTVR|nr:uncharacterized protein UV8b_07608 [Ustilaginoidea virens]QUC23367.1 hypothetical protein UV8b_07608 [Ustilaginoidea virens]